MADNFSLKNDCFGKWCCVALPFCCVVVVALPSSASLGVIVHVHDLIIHEMLRDKDRQGNTTQQKDKATKHNSAKAVIPQRKNCLGWDSNPRPSAC